MKADQWFTAQNRGFTFVNFYILLPAYIQGTRGIETFENSKNHANTWTFTGDNRF